VKAETWQLVWQYWDVVFVLSMVAGTAGATFFCLLHGLIVQTREERRAGILRHPVTGRVVYVPRMPRNRRL
jgi:hypothetical protein